jgi:hypothetical protein
MSEKIVKLIALTSCTKCEHFKTETIYTSDSWERPEKWFCEKDPKVIIDGYHDTFDKDPGIPKNCPLDDYKKPKKKKVVKDICFLMLGLTLVDADILAKKEGYSLRIVEQDGISFCITCDLHSDRVNITLNSGKISKAEIG